MPLATALPPPRRLLLRFLHLTLPRPPAPRPPHLPQSRRLCRRRKPPGPPPRRLLPLPLPDRVPCPRAQPESASTARRSSAAWPRNAASISPPFPVPVRAAASVSKTSKPTSPVALNRQPKLPSPPQRPMLPLHPRRNAPPLRPHRRLLPPAARCTWLLSPPSPAKQCTSAITNSTPRPSSPTPPPST